MSTLLEAAYTAARQGRIEDLEGCLARLRVVAPVQAVELADRLHGIARSVRAHPSFDAGEAGTGSGRAVG